MIRTGLRNGPLLGQVVKYVALAFGEVLPSLISFPGIVQVLLFSLLPAVSYLGFLSLSRMNAADSPAPTSPLSSVETWGPNSVVPN